MVAAFVVSASCVLSPLVGARSLRTQQLKMTAQGFYECAKEGDTVPQGGAARFGIGTQWVEGSLPDGATCGLDAFGSDPAPGTRKVCLCSSEPRPDFDKKREELGVEWLRCATEGQDCDCPSGSLRFGTGQRWLEAELGQQSEKPGVVRKCTADTFRHEDPSLGKTKECWCRQPTIQPDSAKVGIVLLTRRPVDLKTWLQYHLDYMGISHVFMQVEDSPDFNRTFGVMSAKHRSQVSVVSVVPGTTTDKRPQDDYESLQSRQMEHMRRSHAQAAEMGLDWLIHTDDDELLYTPMHRTVGEVLASMPAHYDQAYMPNVEAVFPSANVESCFTQTTEMNTSPYSFVSYANGKSAVRVSNLGAQPAGPHMWRNAQNGDLNSIKLDHEPFGAPLMVVHYESCPFKRWETKYWELANTSPQKINSIPFPWYKSSILKMKQCTSEDQAKDGAVEHFRGGDCSEDSLKQFWSSFKTLANPRISREDLTPIDIPWASIQQADF